MTWTLFFFCELTFSIYGWVSCLAANWKGVVNGGWLGEGGSFVSSTHKQTDMCAVIPHYTSIAQNAKKNCERDIFAMRKSLWLFVYWTSLFLYMNTNIMRALMRFHRVPDSRAPVMSQAHISMYLKTLALRSIHAVLPKCDYIYMTICWRK